MARPTATAALVLLVWTALVAALQVTPNSPCSSFCIDSNNLDYSDPNSSNTYGSDITCSDRSYTSNPIGQKFERCMTCLQTSTFAQGPENDQMWFLYNLRFAFDWCLFGFPNNTDAGSNPCITTTACGPLQNALQDGGLDPTKSTQYGYCQDGEMTTTFYDKCLACVRAEDDHTFLANYLVGLEAGCRQLPVPGKTIGLNDTVFANTVISIVDPTPTAAPGSGGGLHLAVSTIVIIVIAVVVVLLLAAGCGYVQYRKRLARSRGRGVNPDWHRHRHQSSLSFRCQTHVTPREAQFFPSEELSGNSSSDDEEKKRVMEHVTDVQEALGSNPPKHGAVAWSAYGGGRNVQTTFDAPPHARKEATGVPLQSITTSLPNMPPRAHSPTSGTRFFMNSPDDYTTPTSSVSVRSTSALLPIKPYVPAEHHGAAGGGVGMFSSPTSASTASPLLTQGSWPLQQQAQQQGAVRGGSTDPWEAQRGYGGGYNAAVASTTRSILRIPSAENKKYMSSTGRNSGSPVESRQVQTSFPGPPSHR